VFFLMFPNTGFWLANAETTLPRLLTVIDKSTDSRSQLDWVGEEGINSPGPKSGDLSQVYHVLELNLELGGFGRIPKDALMLVAVDDWITWIQKVHDRLFRVWARVQAAGETASRG